jgi:WD40 repeat protein
MLVGAAGLAAAAAAAMLAVAVNAATGGKARWFPTMDQHPLGWVAGATTAVAAAGLMLWWAQEWHKRKRAELVPAVLRLEPWVVKRPQEVKTVVDALRRKRGGTAGLTTAVHGAGGFGKTTVAKMVGADPRVLRYFGNRVHLVILGRDVTKQVLPGQVNTLIKEIDPGRDLTYTDARQAGAGLAAVLASGPRRLLILDDVWTEEQLAAFPVAGGCARLVTTRISSLAADTDTAVLVDRMTKPQARAVLLAGLPKQPPPVVVKGLLEETGRWPLLLRLINKILTNQTRLTSDVAAVAADLLGVLRKTGGKLQIDEMTETAGKPLDVADPEQRAQAVRATIEASTGLLTDDDGERLAELAVFAEDETIPVSLITTLWQATGKLEPVAARALCTRMANLALLAPADAPSGTVIMHDVIRDYLRKRLGTDRLAQLNQLLLDTTAKNLPTVAAVAGPGTMTAWWELPGDAWYLRDHLIEHLIAAGQAGQAEETATDLRWADARLGTSGPAEPYADLALIGTPRTARMCRVLGRSAHLLTPTDPPYSLTDILYSRVSDDPDWGDQAKILAADRKLPALASVWPPPDLPRPALRRTLTGHERFVTAVAVAPDGSWLASVSDDWTMRIWDPATGKQRAHLAGHEGPVTAVAVAPDGDWLVTTSRDNTVRIWDPSENGGQTALLAGHTGRVTAVAVAPDGSWLVTTSRDHTVRIWDAATGKQRTRLAGHTGPVTAVAIAPDGSWLATGGDDGTVRIWDPATGRQRKLLAGHDGPVTAVAIAPDGNWLASVSDDQTVRIWNPATGQQRSLLDGHTDYVTAVAIAPDSSWLVSVSDDNTTRIWDPATGQRTALLTGHTDRVTAVAIAPDGNWLATTSRDNTARIWDTATGKQRALLTGHTEPVTAVAIAPDGSWLATGGQDNTVRIWDPAAGQSEAGLPEEPRRMSGVTFAPHGSWLASVSDDNTVRIWDPATGQRTALLTGHTDRVTAVAIAPNGSWLATTSRDNTARIWDPATGQERALLTGHTGPVTAVAIAPNSSWVATTSHDNTARIWDPATGQQTALLTGHADYVTAVAIASDSSWLATTSHDNTARIWDPATGQQTALLTGHTDYVTAVAIAPDSSWLATTSHDNTARIWDPATGKERATLVGHDGPVTAVAIAPNGSWLATTSHDDTVRIWDTATGKQRALLACHTAPVTAVAIAPTGNWLATTNRDNTVRIWEPAAGSISALMRTDSPLKDCAWSPSGHLLAAAGEAGLYLFAFSS